MIAIKRAQKDRQTFQISEDHNCSEIVPYAQQEFKRPRDGSFFII